MEPMLPSINWGSLQGIIIWWLAFAVGALAGGLIVGLVAQGSVAILSNKKIPLVALWLTRIIGGVVCGLLLATILSGRGAGGFGLGGLWGNGDGKGNRKGPESTASKDSNGTPSKPTDTSQPRESATKTAKPTELVVVEVLPVALADDLQKPIDSETSHRYYRVSVNQETTGARDLTKGRLMGLSELTEIIKTQTNPPVRVVEVVLYKDSPAKGTQRPDSLNNALSDMRNSRDEKINVKPVPEAGDAPR